ncbi:MAG: hypothetical protein IKQ33_02090 [Clostridia bacterium]|nr:hypothetical protein [Clostridia bacterium]
MSTNTKKNALVFDGTTGNVVALDYRTAIDKVKAVDSGAFNRLLKLHENVKFHNSALYEIAWSMKEINQNQDFLYYGYKSTADMMESIYGYGKHSVSRMIAVSTYYTEERNGKHVSFLYDSETETDMPLSNLTELLEKSEVMNYRVEELKQLYTELFACGIISFNSKQKEIRELRKIVSTIIARSLPLNIDSYTAVVEENFKKLETAPTAQNESIAQTAQTASTAPTAPTEPVERDTVSEFHNHLLELCGLYEDETDENKKSEMLKIFKGLQGVFVKKTK